MMLKQTLWLFALGLAAVYADMHYVGGWDPHFCCYPVPDACCLPEGCPQCLDLAIVMDTSQSIGGVALETELKPFVLSIVNSNQWTIGGTNDDYQVALTEFSFTSSIVVNWGEPASQDPILFAAELALVPLGSLTNTGLALKITRQQVLGGPGNRPQCEDVCLVITDGDVNPGSSLILYNQEIGPFQDACDTLIAVGVSTNVSPDFLQSITGPADLSIMVDQFSELESILPELEGMVCDTPPPPPTVCPKCADVVLIVDLSASVGGVAWQNDQKPYLKMFADNAAWDIGSGDEEFQMAVVIFSTTAQLVFNWGDDLTTFNGALDAINYAAFSGLTATGLGMQLARTDVLEGANNRPDCDDYCIVITDGAVNPGPNTDFYNDELPLFKDACDVIIVVGILTNVAPDGLAFLTSQADHSIFIDDFADLIPLFSEVTDSICNGTPEPVDECCPYEYPTYFRLALMAG